MSSAGSPEWHSSQSITAARPDSSTIRLPSRKSPWTRHSRSGGWRRVEAQPAEPRFNGRQRLADLVDRRLPQRASGERGVVLRGGDAVNRSGVDRVDSRERLPELSGQRGAGRLELLAPQHARRDGRPLDVVHHKAGTLQEPASRLEHQATRHVDSGGSRRLHHSELGLEGRERVLRAHRIAPHDPAATVGLGEKRLAGRAPGDGRQTQLARVGPPRPRRSARERRPRVRPQAAASRSSPYRDQWRSGMSAGSLYQYQVQGSRSKSFGGSDG